ncbi:MAG: hypothetical protein GQF41_0781 [Candidatus Rifleibacterium amylolyticum]|nr:MAG: hypothetical protein GQF41_0781 [Candidatus Rifleibacterium amylolyticum]
MYLLPSERETSIPEAEKYLHADFADCADGFMRQSENNS